MVLAPLVPARNWDRHFVSRPHVKAAFGGALDRLADLDDFPSVARYGELLGFEHHVSAGGAPLRFVEQPEKSKPSSRRADLYDARIHERGEIPTRAKSWHDLFNALAWAAFPRAKTALNARQYRALVDRVPESFDRLPGARTPEQDALAMLDEGGLLFVAREPVFETAQAANRDGDEATLARLIDEAEVVALVFGHALHEHALSSSAPVRGRGLVLLHDESLAIRDAADRALAERLTTPDQFPEGGESRGVKAVSLSLALGARPVPLANDR
jgi:hypothetical protein